MSISRALQFALFNSCFAAACATSAPDRSSTEGTEDPDTNSSSHSGGEDANFEPPAGGADGSGGVTAAGGASDFSGGATGAGGTSLPSSGGTSGDPSCESDLNCNSCELCFSSSFDNYQSCAEALGNDVSCMTRSAHAQCAADWANDLKVCQEAITDCDVSATINCLSECADAIRDCVASTSSCDSTCDAGCVLSCLK